jgi:hypothetical protein
LPGPPALMHGMVLAGAWAGGCAMQVVQELLANDKTHSVTFAEILAECIEACASCEFACNACSDACLLEPDIDKLRRCIRLNLDCVDICAATARLLTRRQTVDKHLHAQLEACARVCASCDEECRRHAASHEHCRVCADACRICEEHCRGLLKALPEQGQAGSPSLSF